MWVKDSAGNKATKEFAISLGLPATTLISASTADVYTGKYWSGSSSISSNDWPNSNLQNELNDETNSTGYLYNLINNSNVDEKLSDLIARARWQLGGANNTSSSNYYY